VVVAIDDLLVGVRALVLGAQVVNPVASLPVSGYRVHWDGEAVLTAARLKKLIE
jgi:hypothetical protein